MDFLPKKLEDYINNHTEIEPEILVELNRETNLKILNPRMIAGHLQGRVISMLSHMIKPKKILEIGTYTGYSAICWAEGLLKGGIIHTIDFNEELKDFTLKYFSKNNLKDKIILHIGNAINIIPKIDEKWDLVFIDADKESYLSYFELVINRVKSGGYIIADNVLWSGKILTNYTDKETQGIKDFNKKIQNDKRVQNVLFPIRDGLMICRKL